MQCGGTRVRTDLAGGYRRQNRSRHYHAKSTFILMSYYSMGKHFAFDIYLSSYSIHSISKLVLKMFHSVNSFTNNHSIIHAISGSQTQSRSPQ